MLNKGKASEDVKENFLNAGYKESHLIDVSFVIADKIISNFIAKTADIEIDFPIVKTI